MRSDASSARSLGRRGGTLPGMRIATWNVNSLKARQDAVEAWLARARPDILLMQETKLGDGDAPVMAFAMLGYQLVHHGEGRWNGVAIAARDGLAVSDVVTNFGDGPVRDSGPGRHGRQRGRLRPVRRGPDGRRDRRRAARRERLRAQRPGRRLGVLRRQAALVRAPGALAGRRGGRRPRRRLVVGGDYNVAPGEIDVWDPRAVHGGTHVSSAERDAVAALQGRGLVDAYRSRHDEPGRYSWWDYRAGMFHKNFGMRIDLLLVGSAVAARIVDAEIDRAARKGPPVPSDHAPVTMDLDEPGAPIDPDWAGALQPHRQAQPVARRVPQVRGPRIGAPRAAVRARDLAELAPSTYGWSRPSDRASAPNPTYVLPVHVPRIACIGHNGPWMQERPAAGRNGRGTNGRARTAAAGPRPLHIRADAGPPRLAARRAPTR